MNFDVCFCKFESSCDFRSYFKGFLCWHETPILNSNPVCRPESWEYPKLGPHRIQYTWTWAHLVEIRFFSSTPFADKMVSIRVSTAGRTHHIIHVMLCLAICLPQKRRDARAAHVCVFLLYRHKKCGNNGTSRIQRPSANSCEFHSVSLLVRPGWNH